MRIPRQSDGSADRTPVRPAAADELRARRRQLVEQLRSVGYWQRLAQARTDLSVAGLLYAAPVPTGVAPGAWGGAGRALLEDREVDLAGLASPPDGVDVQGLVGSGPGAEGPGAHLDRLREVTLVLVRRSRDLQEELDVVTRALHERLALDGTDTDGSCDEPDPGGRLHPHGVTGPHATLG